MEKKGKKEELETAVQKQPADISSQRGRFPTATASSEGRGHHGTPSGFINGRQVEAALSGSRGRTSCVKREEEIRWRRAETRG